MNAEELAAGINAIGDLTEEVLTPFAKVHGELAASQVVSIVVLCTNLVNTTKLLRQMASDESHIQVILAIDIANQSATAGILKAFFHGKDDAYCEAFKNVVSIILNKIDRL